MKFGDKDHQTLSNLAFETSIHGSELNGNTFRQERIDKMKLSSKIKSQSFNIIMKDGTPKSRKQKKTKTNIVLASGESFFLSNLNDQNSRKDIGSAKITFGAKSERGRHDNTKKIIQQIGEKIQKQKYSQAQEKMKCRTEKSIRNSENQYFGLHKKFEKIKLKTPQEYSVDLYKIYGYKRLEYEMNIYQDNYRFLQLRKLCVRIIYGMLIILNYIQRSLLYKIFMSGIIVMNLVIFVQKTISFENQKFQVYEQIVIYIYISDQIVRLMTKGLIGHKHAYFRVVKNYFDLILTILQINTTLIHNILVVDFSPLRLITLLLYLGDFIPGLKLMLTSLGKSFKYLIKALMIVFIFNVFFASLGSSLFHGLINYRCLPVNYENADETPWIACRITSCPDDLTCQYVPSGPILPTSFNNIFCSYAQVLRTITMDDWTWIMYFTLSSFGNYIWVYYLLIIFFGGFFGFNLVIAVLKIHYSQQTKQKIIQQDDQHQQEENLNLQTLKKYGLYLPLHSYKMFLKGERFLQYTAAGSLTSLSSEQPRILSGKHYSKYDNKYRIFQQLSFKTLMLPKFFEIRKFQNLLQDLYDNLLEKPHVNIDCLIHNEFTRYWADSKNASYVATSTLDIIQAKSEKTQIKLIYHKDYHFRYQTKNNNEKTNINQGNSMFPVKKSKRLKDNIDSAASSGITLMEIHQSKATTTLQQTMTINPHQNLLISQQLKRPSNFIIQKEQGVYIKIYGFYHNYKAVSELINKKIQKKNPDEIKDYEEKYLQIRTMEMQTNIIEKKNCSISSVMQFYKHKNFIKHTLNTTDSVIWLNGIKGKIIIFRKIVFNLVSSKFSTLFVDGIILMNFIFLSSIGIVSNELISFFEDVTTIIVSIELIAKIIAFQTSKLILKDQILVETIIVLINFSELTFRSVLSYEDIVARLLRGTKILLFYRCLKYIRMAVLIGMIARRTFKQYIYLTFLMFLMILIYGLLGMAVYAEQFNETSLLGHLHTYHDPLKAWMTVFNIMTNDDWYGILGLGSEVNQVFAFIYSFSMVHFLNYITYGLVMAILLDGFGEYLVLIKEGQQIDFEDNESHIDDSDSDTEKDNTHTKSLKIFQSSRSIQKDSQYWYLIQSIQQIVRSIKTKSKKIYLGIDCNESLFYFSKQHKLRRTCVRIVSSQTFYFSRLILQIGFIVLMALQTYDLQTQIVVDVFILLINLAISIQLIMLLIALGTIQEKGTYIQHIWQVLDIIYLVSYFMSLANQNSRILKLLLYIRYLRPFKLLYSFQPIIKIYNSLVAALYNMINVFVTLLIIWTMFAVYGMILYQDKFGFCENLMNFNINQQDCNQQGSRWIVYQHNFDNITVALPTLFVISTFDGWGEILQVSENSRSADLGPAPFANQLPSYIFLTLFCFIGSMFFLSLFTGLLFLNLKASQQKIEYDDLTVYQQEFIQVSQKILRDSPAFSQPPQNILRKFSQSLNSNVYYQTIAFFILIVDTIIQLSFYQNMDFESARQLNICYECISVLFTLWVVIQILAYGLKRFFDDSWRCFYTFIALYSLFDVVASQHYNLFEVFFTSNMFTKNYQIIRFVFALRNLRILILFKGFEDMQRLIRIMIFSFPFLGKILFILIVTTLSYALLGQDLYHHIDKGIIMDYQINFKTFSSSLLTLLKCGSCDNFRTVMIDTMIYNPYCLEDPKYCGSQFNELYFISFVFISNYVLLNLFVLGLIEQFEKFFQSENSILQVYIESIDKIKTVWCKYSYQKHGRAMHYHHISKFLLEIGQPFTHVKDNIWDAARLAGYLKIRADDQGYIQFNSLVYEIFRRTFKQQVFKEGSEDSIKIIKKINKEMQMRLFYFRRDKYQKRSFIATYVEFNSNFSIASDYLSILVMFKAWQNYSNLLLKRSKLGKVNFSDNSSFGQEVQDIDIFSGMDEEEELSKENLTRKIPACPVKSNKCLTIESENNLSLKHSPSDLPMYNQNENYLTPKKNLPKMGSSLINQLQRRSIIVEKNSQCSILKLSSTIKHPKNISEISFYQKSSQLSSQHNSFRSFISHSESSLDSIDGIPGMIT